MSANETFAASELGAALRKIGLYELEEHYQDFIDTGVRMLQRAGRAGGFAHDPSCLMLDAPALQRACTSLIIDIGGSHTKVGVAWRQTSGQQEWQTLFDFNNSEFDRPGPGLPIERFVRSLAQEIRSAAAHLKIGLKELEGVGVIWSNALKSARLPLQGKTFGVTGSVTSIGTGKSYRKGEFFITGLYEGFDVGAIFLEGMLEIGITPRAFVVGNDTIFTLKATKGADAGMVNSTGANATDVDDDGYIFNTEMGGLYEMQRELLSKGDELLLRGRAPDESIKLEDLIAGKWLPRVFEGHVAAAGRRYAELAPLAAELNQSQFFQGKDVAALLTHGALPPQLERFQPTVPLLRFAAEEVVRRAGRLAAGMAYFALYHQLQRKQAVLLSLDSTQALHLPGYLAAMEQQLAALIGPGKKAAIVLQRPSGEITVPMKGLAAALADELALLEAA